MQCSIAPILKARGVPCSAGSYLHPCYLFPRLSFAPGKRHRDRARRRKLSQERLLQRQQHLGQQDPRARRFSLRTKVPRTPRGKRRKSGPTTISRRSGAVFPSSAILRLGAIQKRPLKRAPRTLKTPRKTAISKTTGNRSANCRRSLTSPIRSSTTFATSKATTRRLRAASTQTMAIP